MRFFNLFAGFKFIVLSSQLDQVQILDSVAPDLQYLLSNSTGLVRTYCSKLKFATQKIFRPNQSFPLVQRIA